MSRKAALCSWFGIVSESIECLEQEMEAWKEALASKGLKLTIKKTKTMIVVRNLKSLRKKKVSFYSL